MLSNSVGRENISLNIFSIRIGKLDTVFTGDALVMNMSHGKNQRVEN